MQFHRVEAEFFHGERRTEEKTDMTKLIVAFRNFDNPPPPLPKKCNSKSSLSRPYHIFTK
jgi:hypothetical protein